MRPLPVEPVAGSPPYVRGVALVRGGPVPIVDVACLLTGIQCPRPTRFVTMVAGGRRVGVAVDSVIGVSQVASDRFPALPPLLDHTRDVVSAIGMRDTELMVVLRGARLIPEDVWATIDANRAGA